MTRLSLMLLLLIVAGLAGSGCDLSSPSSGPALTQTSFASRAARRLYDGAPPVIPHAPLKIQCIACHTDTGKEAPPLGFAPANPHAQTTGLSSTSHCQQCHVFQRQSEVFAETDFQGLTQRPIKGERLYPGAPPVIPHRLFMRENCLSCHGGVAGRVEIRCSHPLRSNCRQCHVPNGAGDGEIAIKIPSPS
jgi:cytochrome c-type protein NapB